MQQSLTVQELLGELSFVEDFPKPGVRFLDICPLLTRPHVMSAILSEMKRWLIELEAEAIVALEARGFLFGAALSEHTKVPLVLVRKQGKLPGPCHSVTYEKEYGSDTLEMQVGSLQPEMKAVIVDDVIATGGSVTAACTLIREQQAHPLACLCLAEISACRPQRQVTCDVRTLLSV